MNFVDGHCNGGFFFSKMTEVGIITTSEMKTKLQGKIVIKTILIIF